MQDAQAGSWNVKIFCSIVHYTTYVLHNYFDSSTKLF